MNTYRVTADIYAEGLHGYTVRSASVKGYNETDAKERFARWYIGPGESAHAYQVRLLGAT